MRRQRHSCERASFLIYILLLKTITRSQLIRCGEHMICSLFCPNPNTLWYGSDNQTIVNNSDKYQLKNSQENVQLIIAHFTVFDQGEYMCVNNESKALIQRYQLEVGTMKDLLPLFFLFNSVFLLLIPIVCYCTRKYSTSDS